MRSISFSLKRERLNDAITPSATATQPRAASWLGRPPADDWTPLRLEPEDPNLLQDYLRAGMPSEARPACRILEASRTEQERQRRTAALAAALDYEAAVAEATLILRPNDVTAAAYLDLMHAALPVVSDRALPLAVTR